MTMPEISVIVPALDEEEHVVGALRSARTALGSRAELLVVDGGSSDRTRERAAPLARVLRAGSCRGEQLDTGARAARGRILVFLHADTRLAPDAGHALRRALARPGAVGGCFRFAVDPPSGTFSRWRLLEASVRFRTRWFRTATGDQVLFALRDAYREAGGFPSWPLFEDVELVRRLRRVGGFVRADAPAHTSRRRWETRGFWRTVATHVLLRVAYAAGVSPQRLARLYEDARGRPGVNPRRTPRA